MKPDKAREGMESQDMPGKAREGQGRPEKAREGQRRPGRPGKAREGEGS